MKTPAYLYLEIAAMVDPFGDDDTNALAANPSFRGAVDHAYQAGWREHERLINVQPGAAIPPEVYP